MHRPDPSSLLPAVILAALAGCGSIAVEPSSGGSTTGVASSSGGAGGSSTASTSGAGGSAGGAQPCAHLVQDGALVALPSIPASMTLQPKLRPLDAGRMAIVATLAIPGMGPRHTVASTLAWTAAWPPVASAPAVLIDRPWYVSSSAPLTPTRLALLGSEAGSSAIVFGFADPEQGGFTPLLVTDPQAIAPSFLAADAEGTFLTGMAASAGIPDNNVAVPHLGWVSTASAPSYVGPIALGCPIDPVNADALAVPGGWLMAHSAFADDCMGSGGKIEVLHFTGQTSQPGASLDSGTWPWVELRARPGGAWLFFPGGPSGVTIARLGVLGELQAGPLAIEVPQLSAQLFFYGADALADGLIALFADGEPSPAFHVVVTDPGGKALTEVPLAGTTSGATGAQIAFDPGTRKALVALTVPDPAAPGKPYTHVEVARFRCE